ncbi:hypothetical protein Hanom_Chr08g00743251 [Helianthus anomalus]
MRIAILSSDFVLDQICTFNYEIYWMLGFESGGVAPCLFLIDQTPNLGVWFCFCYN